MSKELLNKVTTAKVEQLIDFAKTFVFKDHYAAQTDEDDKSQTFSHKFLIEQLALVARDYSFDSEVNLRANIATYLANTKNIYENYKVSKNELIYYGELNKYYRDMYVEKNVDIFVARTSEHFEIIHYTNSGKLSEKEISDFLQAYQDSRILFMKTVYTESFGTTESFFNFCKFFITFQAIQMYVNNTMKAVFDVDQMDEYSVENLLYSYGIYFLKGLSQSYKKKLLKNLNFLFNNKGNDKIFTTILGIFGLENVQAFKYYIIKDHRDSITKLNDKQDVLFNLIDPVLADKIAEIDNNVALTEPERVELRHVTKVKVNAQIKYNAELREKYRSKNVKNLDKTDPNASQVKFIRVPFEEKNFDKFTSENKFDVYTYSEITSADPTWKIKEEDVAKLQFNAIQTKYFDIRSSFDVLKLTTQLQYFYNVLKSIKTNFSPSAQPEYLQFNAGSMSSRPVNVFDGLIGLQLITSAIVGYDMRIIKSQSAVHKIYTFNDNGFNPLQLSQATRVGLGIFTGYQDINQLVNQSGSVSKFNDKMDYNFQIKQKIEQMMLDESSPPSYFDIQKDYYALFFQDNNQKIFEEYETYDDYLEQSNPEFAAYIKNITSLTDKDIMRQEFEKVNDVISSAIQSTQFNPGIMNGDYLNYFIFKLIEYFKSYTIQLKDLSIFYTFDNQFLNRIKFLDEIFLLLTIPRFSDQFGDVKDEIVKLVMSGSNLHSQLIQADKSLQQIIYNMVDSLTEMGLNGFNPEKFESDGEYYDIRGISQLIDRKNIHQDTPMSSDVAPIFCMHTCNTRHKIQSSINQSDRISLQITNNGQILWSKPDHLTNYTTLQQNRPIINQYDLIQDGPKFQKVFINNRYNDSDAMTTSNQIYFGEVWPEVITSSVQVKSPDPRVGFQIVPQNSVESYHPKTDDRYYQFPGLTTERAFNSEMINFQDVVSSKKWTFEQGTGIAATRSYQLGTIPTAAGMYVYKLVALRLNNAARTSYYGWASKQVYVQRFADGRVDIAAANEKASLNQGLIFNLVNNQNTLELRVTQSSEPFPTHLKIFIVQTNDIYFNPLNVQTAGYTKQTKVVADENMQYIDIITGFNTAVSRRPIAIFDKQKFDTVFVSFHSHSNFHQAIFQNGFQMFKKVNGQIEQSDSLIIDTGVSQIRLILETTPSSPILTMYIDEQTMFAAYKNTVGTATQRFYVTQFKF